MAQQQQSALFKKPTDSSHKELSQQLQEANESNKELEEKLNGLQGKLSIAEQEKLQLQKVSDIAFLMSLEMKQHFYHTELWIVLNMLAKLSIEGMGA